MFGVVVGGLTVFVGSHRVGGSGGGHQAARRAGVGAGLSPERRAHKDPVKPHHVLAFQADTQ